MQILTTIALIIIGILLFEFIIFAHEFGHFITAKKSGVQVNEFALGMGPKLISFQKGETRYSLRLFPIGGFCAMEGEDANSDNPRAFTNAKVWKRMIIIVAGAFMNFVVGFLLMFIVVVQQPVFESTIVSGFIPDSFSANCGLQAGDKIVDVNGYGILNSRDLQFAIQTLPCENVDPASLEVYKQDCAIGARNTFVYLRDHAKELYGAELTDDELQELYNILSENNKAINTAASREEAYDAMKASIDKMYEYKNLSATKKPEYPTITVRDERQRFQGDVTVERDGARQKLENVQFYSYYASEEAKEQKNAAIAIINDVGNVNDIHPNEKELVGQRLALHALKRDYGFSDIQDNSPTLSSRKIDGDTFVLYFNDAEKLYMYNPDFSLDTPFEIAGEDGEFKPAQIVNLRKGKKGGRPRGGIDGTNIVVRAEGVAKPVKLRYAYSSPWKGSIYNEADLPLGAFSIGE